MARAKTKTKQPAPSDDSENRVERLYLRDLKFDPQNPRFGDLTAGVTEADILDEIVERFGVDDVLSSLAVNGYMGTEPLVGIRENDGKVRIVEGNRRLAAYFRIAIVALIPNF